MSCCEESLLMYTAIEHYSPLSLSPISPSHSLCFSLWSKLLLEAPRPPWPNILLIAVRRPSSSKALLPKASRPTWSHISPSLCSPTDHWLSRPNSMNGQATTLSAIQVVTHVTLRPDPFYYSLFGNIKLNYNIGILCYTLDNIKKICSSSLCVFLHSVNEAL